jgi:hypothetical protein
MTFCGKNASINLKIVTFQTKFFICGFEVNIQEIRKKKV